MKPTADIQRVDSLEESTTADAHVLMTASVCTFIIHPRTFDVNYLREANDTMGDRCKQYVINVDTHDTRSLSLYIHIVRLSITKEKYC